MVMADLPVRIPYGLEADRIAFHPDKKTLRMAETFGLKPLAATVNGLRTWEIHGDLLVLRGADGPLCVLEKIR